MTALIDACVPLALATSDRRAGAQVLPVGDGVPEAGLHVPRIMDLTGITFTIHEC